MLMMMGFSATRLLPNGCAAKSQEAVQSSYEIVMTQSAFFLVLDVQPRASDLLTKSSPLYGLLPCTSLIDYPTVAKTGTLFLLVRYGMF